MICRQFESTKILPSTQTNIAHCLTVGMKSTSKIPTGRHSYHDIFIEATNVSQANMSVLANAEETVLDNLDDRVINEFLPGGNGEFCSLSIQRRISND